ncbi:MAG: oligosaccharide flippase family protein [Anaerolineaceae bacterium]|nr:oligosaccharide flippase family protein [Anaerolineaceae bacterium]
MVGSTGCRRVGFGCSGCLFFVVELIGLWFCRRPWQPTFKTEWQTIKSYFQFGKFHLIAINITLLLDTFDDFWVGTFLGSNPLGFYSKAYEFARYPRGVVADPISRVAFPIFARFQTDRYLLSRTFFQASSILVRVGFGLAGVFAFVAPEFIRLFLGSKWLPMQLTFQLMIVYTLLDPLLLMIRQLFLANGKPKILARIQLWQMLFFLPAVIIFSRFWAIEGVALAADLMLMLGFLLVLPALRQTVDFSLQQLVAVPLLALILSWVGGAFIIRWLPEGHTAVILVQKGLTMTLIYAGILLLLEHKQIIESTRTIKQLLHQ